MNERLSEFLDLIGDKTISFEEISDRHFHHFWKYLIIYRHQPDNRDFHVIHFGTDVVGSYGEDWTGKILSQVSHEMSFEQIYNDNLEVMENRSRLFANGDLDWQDRGFKKWHQVKMPLMRNGGINEVLICMCFD
jgi:hypothetical protein